MFPKKGLETPLRSVPLDTFMESPIRTLYLTNLENLGGVNENVSGWVGGVPVGQEKDRREGPGRDTVADPLRGKRMGGRTKQNEGDRSSEDLEELFVRVRSSPTPTPLPDTNKGLY